MLKIHKTNLAGGQHSKENLPNEKHDSMAMNIRLSLQIIFFLTSSTVLLMVYYSNYSEIPTFKLTRILRFPGLLTNTDIERSSNPGFAILSPQCKMLDPNPWNETIHKYLIEPKPLICSRLPLLTYIEEKEDYVNILKINKKIIHKYRVRPNHLIKCCYHVITRISQTVDNYNISADSLYELSNCENFTDEVRLANDTEFILVKCQSIPKDKKSGKEVYRDVHAVVPLLPTASDKVNKIKERETQTDVFEPEMVKSDSKRLNVVIIGIDSVSKLNLRRVMPRTLKYLQENSWVELNGYNKVGENTFPNLMAILSGEPMHKLNEICWANHSKKMDDCPSIWKEFNRNGYVTLYAEDTPSISTFNLLRTGFVEKPTDYYMRPFMLAAHDLLRLKNLNGLPVCLGPVLIVDHILTYAKRFFRAFNPYNFFSLLWLNSLSHNDVNAPKALDISVHKFLTELTSLGTYENSLILLLSDHGVRFGYIRETFLGYLEERLPFMFIWLPKWFRERHPDRYSNVLINQNRLTSPYDVYVTIKKILDEDNNEMEQPEDMKPISSACPKCTGLLEAIPLERTCVDASVDINWCLCSEFKEINTKDTEAVQTGKFLYKFIEDHTNKLIEKENITKSLCSKWKFLRIFTVQEIVPPNTNLQYSIRNSSNAEISRHTNQKRSLNTRIFVIIIELNPGKTKFESTIRMDVSPGSGTNFAFMEPPKRLDSIYKTSKCVTPTLLKHYCYCVKR